MAYSALERGVNIITSPDKIAATFADHYANISRNLHKKSKSGKTKKRSYHIITFLNWISDNPMAGGFK